MYRYVLLSLLLVGSFMSCSDDDMNEEMEMEEEMVESIDITSQLLCSNYLL